LNLNKFSFLFFLLYFFLIKLRKKVNSLIKRPNLLGSVYFIESGFLKTTFQLFYIYLPLEKLINKKHFLVKEIFGVVFKKVFFFYSMQNILSRLKNILLFFG
jgi:hypothetical protein